MIATSTPTLMIDFPLHLVDTEARVRVQDDNHNHDGMRYVMKTKFSAQLSSVGWVAPGGRLPVSGRFMRGSGSLMCTVYEYWE